jgi:hypothetical protein
MAMKIEWQKVQSYSGAFQSVVIRRHSVMGLHAALDFATILLTVLSKVDMAAHLLAGHIY